MAKAGTPPGRSVGIKEIARELGLSIGTVDRALHGRPGINALTKKRVLQMAETLGYKPNLAARYLKSRKQFAFSVNLPREIASFFDAVRAGIESAAAAVSMSVRVDFRTYRRLGEGDAEQFEKALSEGASGIIFAPVGQQSKSLIRQAAQRSVPVVCVATDAPGTERLTAVSVDARTSGAMAGELITRFHAGPGAAAFVTGSLDIWDHAEKLEGFREGLEACGRSLELREVIEAHDDEREAFERTREILDRHADLTAIYVSTANSVPVLRAIDRSRRQAPLTVITTDLFPGLIPYLRSGKVAATLYQRPVRQGRLAFEALHNFLLHGQCPQPRIRLLPHLVMRSNLDVVVEKTAS